jgi:hypothetical protein
MYPYLLCFAPVFVFRSSLVLLGINQDVPVATETSSVSKQEQTIDAASAIIGATNLEPLEQ